MRIHAWLAKHTDLSRRSAEDEVKEGNVKIDNKIAAIGQKVDSASTITLNGKIIRHVTIDRQLIALHKPVGYVCSRKPQDKQLSIYDLLPKLTSGKWILVGRLDINTSGLILATTDGVLANALAHPSNGYQKEYIVRVSQELTPDKIMLLKSGVMLEDGMASVDAIKPHKHTSKGINAWYSLTITEGRNRIVRRLMAEMGISVSRLIRVRFGKVKLDKALATGHYQVIDSKWVNQIMDKL